MPRSGIVDSHLIAASTLAKAVVLASTPRLRAQSLTVCRESAPPLPPAPCGAFIQIADQDCKTAIEEYLSALLFHRA